MSKAPIDRTNPDYKARKAALDEKLKTYLDEAKNNNTYETPLPTDVRNEMDALGIELKGNDIVEVVAAPEQELGVSKPQIDDVNAIDEAIKQNSNPQKNKKSYGDVKSLMDQVANGSLTIADAQKQLDKIGAENGDAALKFYLTSVNAILNHSLNSDQRNEALAAAHSSFAFFGDEKAQHDLEAALIATKKVCESDKIPDKLKIEIEAAVADIAIEVEDKSLQQQKSPAEQSKADEKKDPKKISGEQESGVDVVNVVKKTVKYGAALSLAVGFPPFGIAMAIGVLYMARNWGANEKEVKNEEFEKGKEMMLSAQQRIAQAKGKGAAKEAQEQEGAIGAANMVEAIANVAQDVQAEVRGVSESLQSVAIESKGAVLQVDDKKREVEPKIEPEVSRENSGYLEILPEEILGAVTPEAKGKELARGIVEVAGNNAGESYTDGKENESSLSQNEPSKANSRGL